MLWSCCKHKSHKATHFAVQIVSENLKGKVSKSMLSGSHPLRSCEQSPPEVSMHFEVPSGLAVLEVLQHIVLAE